MRVLTQRSSGRRPPGSIAVVVMVLGALALAGSASANHGTMQRVAVGPEGGNGDFDAIAIRASADGSRLFVQTNEPLVASDTDSSQDVYQRAGSVTTLLSTGPNGGNGAFDAFEVANSTDGTRVFISTEEQLVSADTDTRRDIYERSGSATTQITTGPTGGNGIAHVSTGKASADGTRFFFATFESLVSADTDGSTDVYERSGSTTTLLSTGPAGGSGVFEAELSGISQDGTRAFITTSESLVSGDTDSQRDIYQRSGGTTTLISTVTAGGNGAFPATFAGSSVDGTRVFFTTNESLAAADTDSSTDLYQRSGSSTTLISTGPTGGNGAFAASFNTASADGTRVMFSTNESLVAGDTDASTDVYQRLGSTTTQLSTGPAGGNGAFDALGGFSAVDGTRAIILTEEPLVAGDTDAQYDTYERVGTTTTLLSTGPAGGNGPFLAVPVAWSADGTRVFFYTAEPLVSADTDSQEDLYERFGGTTTLVSFGFGGGNGPFPAGLGQVLTSTDGTRVFFDTQDALLAGDLDGSLDIYAAGIANTALYPRPGSATPSRVALVPAFEPCTDPNSGHAAPVEQPSCNPPQLVSDFLTLGTGGLSSGFVRVDAILGNPGTIPDEANFAIQVFLSDVRKQSDGTDYVGELQVSMNLRITDRLSGVGSSDPATVADTPFEFAVPCTATGGSAGATCSLTTTADTLVPGMVTETRRSIFDVVETRVLDGGSDGDADTGPNTLLATDGFFVP